jgi:transcription elongation GreA/GreB family factor
MTVEGFKKLEAELHRLKAEERPRIIQQIADAREHGDLFRERGVSRRQGGAGPE